VDRLTLFGLFAVTAMLVSYALERRSHWFILAFAVSCGLGSAYGFLLGAWPFGLVEAVWSLVALRKWTLTLGGRAAGPKPPATGTTHEG
jgi:hypothetical protein